MPPKKAQAAKAVSRQQKGEQKHKEAESEGDTASEPHVKQSEVPAEDKQTPEEEVQEANGDAKDHRKACNDATPASKKRKAPASSSKSPAKAPRKGTRTSSHTAGSTSSAATPKQILNFLLSSKALPYCYPEDELSSTNAKMRTYSKTSPAEFTAFEHLLTASLLSKPLKHTLGMRSTRVLLNEPFSLNTPEKILKVGERHVWEALEAACTQHRQKTARYVYQMAQTYKDHAKLDALKKTTNEEGAAGVVRQIKNDVKGMGPTGAELFCRRVQCVEGWGDAIWPFADAKSMEAVRAVGLKVADADELEEMIEREVDWDELGDMALDTVDKEVDMKRQVQVELVVVLERALGALLEGKVEKVRKAAAEHS